MSAIYVAIFLISFFGWAILMAMADGMTHKTRDRIMGWATIAALTLMLSPVYYEFPLSGGAVATFKDGEITTHPLGVFSLAWIGETAHLPGDVSASGEVTTITENPKARRVSYSVLVKVISPEKYFSKEYRRGLSSTGRDIEKTAHFWFYEFNEEKSKALSSFYNPESEEQQKAFKSFLEEYLNPRLEPDGLAVEAERFWVN